MVAPKEEGIEKIDKLVYMGEEYVSIVGC